MFEGELAETIPVIHCSVGGCRIIGRMCVGKLRQPCDTPNSILAWSDLVSIDTHAWHILVWSIQVMIKELRTFCSPTYSEDAKRDTLSICSG